MGQSNHLLTPSDRSALQLIAKQKTNDGKRAQALLAINDGQTQAEAAATSGLTLGQVKYIRQKYGKQGLAAFSQVPDTKAGKPAPDDKQPDDKLSLLIAELDDLVNDLKEKIPERGQSPYSPLQLVKTLRQNVSRMTPEMQLGILESFEGMTAEDLMDLDTWKGLAYMMSYSARFQAEKVKDRMNDQLPSPLKPDTVLSTVKQNLDKVTPELMKDLYQNLQGTTPEDWLDPDTWKGMWYMINYSLQFQVDNIRQRITGEDSDVVDS